VTGKPLSAGELAVTLLGVIFGSGAIYRQLLEELQEGIRRERRLSAATRREADEVVEEVLEKAGDLVAAGRLKAKGIPEGLQKTDPYKYQMQVTGGRPIEYEGVLDYDIPQFGNTRPRRGTVQLDGLEEYGGELYAIEAKWKPAGQPLAESAHLFNEAKFKDYMFRLSDYVQQNGLAGAIIRCSDQELAEYYVAIVEMYSEYHHGRIGVEVVPAAF